MTAAECRSADRQCWLTSGYARERHHQAAALCLFGLAIHLQACRQFALPGGAKTCITAIGFSLSMAGRKTAEEVDLIL